MRMWKVCFEECVLMFLRITEMTTQYDLTYSNTYYGEHTTTVDGNGKDPGRKELLAVGITAGMKKNRCMEIIDEIERCVGEMLGDYLQNTFYDEPEKLQCVNEIHN